LLSAERLEHSHSAIMGQIMGLESAARSKAQATTKSSIFEKIEEESYQTRPFFDRSLGSKKGQAIFCLLVALLSRGATFGDPAIHIDEAWYFLVGQWMHEGALPYVDVWDRKPFLLFGLYYLFAGISQSVLSYQIAAYLAVSATGFVIIRVASRLTETQGAVLAGAAYIVLLNSFEGIGGQTPIFYNLLIAFAAYTVVTSIRELSNGLIPSKVFVAMLLCGIAIQIKQTTLFESVFFGITIVYLLWKCDHQMPWGRILLLALLGAAPTILVSLFYLKAGHWPEYWHAMVGSNLSKQSVEPFRYVARGVKLLVLTGPIIVVLVAAFRLGLRTQPAKSYRGFLAFWLIAAMIGFISVPNLYAHYFLPVLVPIATIAAVELNRNVMGLFWTLLLATLSLAQSEAFAFGKHRQNAEEMHGMAQLIEEHAPRGTFLAFDAPPLLFSLSGTISLSPLTFPNHLNHTIENDVSHIPTHDEMRRIIDQMPGAVAISSEPRVRSYDIENWNLVLRYVFDHCDYLGSGTIQEIGRHDTIWVFGDCN
jgi:hypothetical protein